MADNNTQESSYYNMAGNLVNYVPNAVSHMLTRRLPNYISEGADYLFGDEKYKQQERMDRADADRFGLSFDDPYWREKLTTARWEDKKKAYRGDKPTYNEMRSENKEKATGLGSHVWDQLDAANAKETIVSSEDDAYTKGLKNRLLPREQQQWYIDKLAQDEEDARAAQALIAAEPATAQPTLADDTTGGFARALANSTGVDYQPSFSGDELLLRLGNEGFTPRRTYTGPRGQEQLNDFFADVQKRIDARKAIEQRQALAQALREDEEELNRDQNIQGQAAYLAEQNAPDETLAQSRKLASGENYYGDEGNPNNQGSGQSAASRMKTLGRNEQGTRIVSAPDGKDPDKVRNMAAFKEMYPDYKKDDSWKYGSGTRQSRAYNKASMMDPDNMRSHNMDRASQGYIDMSKTDDLKRMGIYQAPKQQLGSNTRTPQAGDSLPIRDNRTRPSRREQFVDKALEDGLSANEIAKIPSAGVNQGGWHTRKSVQPALGSTPKKKEIRDGFIDPYMEDMMAR